MKEFRERRCPECGKGRVRLVAKLGRKRQHRGLLLTVPEDFQIPTCDNCGEEGFRGDMVEAYMKAMDEVYRQEFANRALKMIKEVTRHITQTKLERLFGLSHGYLSKVRNGNVVPSQALLSGLALLTTEPEKRIHELEKQWELDS
jgi:transcriptional regulator with XRE-family HTH domain